MSDLMKRIAMIAQQSEVDKSSLENLKSKVQQRRDWDAEKPKTLEEKRRFIIAALKK